MAYHSYTEIVLRALSTVEGSYIYQIVARTGLDRKDVSRVLSRLINKERMITRVEEPGIGYKYFLKHERFGEVPARLRTTNGEERPVEHKLSFMDETVLWHRVSMLKKMRDRLIEEHHPLLNLVIGDYEEFLRLRD